MSKRNGRIPDRTREAILAALLAGAGVCQAARTYRVSKSSVSNIARAAGLDTEQPSTKKAHAAAATYARGRRLELGNRLFASIEAALDYDLEPQQLLRLVTAYAILVDKRRLEEGEVTERHGHRDDFMARLERAERGPRLLQGRERAES